MLEINVIKKRKKASSKLLGLELKNFNIKFLLIAAVVYFGPVMVLEGYFDGEISDARGEVKSLTTKKKKIEKEIKNNEHLKLELEAYNDKIKELKDKEEQVEKIIKQKTNPKNLLERLARTMPDDVWFVKLTIDDKKKIKFIGESTSYRSIGDFFNKVKKSSFFDKNLDLKIKKNKTVKYDGRDVRVEQFEISGKVSAFNPF